MSIQPDRVVNITAAGNSIQEYMAALYAYVTSAASTWSVALQTETTNESLTGILLQNDGTGGTYAVDDILAVDNTGATFVTGATVRVTAAFSGFVTSIAIDRHPGRPAGIAPDRRIDGPRWRCGGVGDQA